MDFAEVRQLIRLRYEVRRLVAEGRGAEARPLLDRMLSLAARDAAELAAIMPELDRWESTLGP
jgi:hypothetical protein